MDGVSALRGRRQGPHFVCWNWSGEALEFDLTDWQRLDGLLDGGERALADEYLAWLGVGAEPTGKVRHWAEGAVVVAAFEASPAERGVAGSDADPEREFDAALAPAVRKLVEAFLCREREADGLKLVVLDWHWVVEENHQAVAGEVLKRPFIGRDQLTKGTVVGTEHFEQLLRLCRLDEAREAAKVAEEARDVGAVASKELLALV